MKNSSVSMAVGLACIVSFSAGAQARIDLEAKAATLSPALLLTNGCIVQAALGEPATPSRAVFPFTIASQGSYAILARVETTGTNVQTLRINIDAEPEDRAMTWEIPATPTLSERLVNWRSEGPPAVGPTKPKVFQLSAGSHQLIVLAQQPGTKLAGVSILPLPAPPTNLRIMSSSP